MFQSNTTRKLLSLKNSTNISNIIMKRMFGVVSDSIESKLRYEFKPVHLDVIDESHKHAGHQSMQSHSRKDETHFKVVIVS